PAVAPPAVDARVTAGAPRAEAQGRAPEGVRGVAAGPGPAGQRARVAASAAADGREIAGILVADPDPADHTTGRIPQVTRPAQPKMPTRVTGMPTHTKRQPRMTRR